MMIPLAKQLMKETITNVFSGRSSTSEVNKFQVDFPIYSKKCVDFFKIFCVDEKPLRNWEIHTLIVDNEGIFIGVSLPINDRWLQFNFNFQKME